MRIDFKGRWVRNTLACLLALCAVGNVAQHQAYTKLRRDTQTLPLQKIELASLHELESEVYGKPDPWLWHAQARGISRQRAVMAPVATPGASGWVKTVMAETQGEGTQARTLYALQRYMDTRDALAATDFGVFADGGLYCDENAAIFRNLLMRMGIQSRVVVFQFSDGDGGASHTVLETWLPEQGRWVYTDPHYGAYADQSVHQLVRGEGTPVLLVETNRAEVVRLFTEGARSLMYERHSPHVRVVYR